MQPIDYFFIYVMAINLLGLVLMGYDKSRARTGGRRISERNLLLAALAGGSAGVALGMKVFRHKTRHAKFTVLVPAILVLQLFAFGGLLKGKY